MMQICLSVFALIITIIAHEIAHGWVAWRLGDNTAQKAGRLSLNPIKHIDVFGTVILPIILFFSKTGFVFGWAKPVPINYKAFKKTKRDIILVASAGIITNIVLAMISVILLKITFLLPENMIKAILAYFWFNLLLFNTFFAIFNLLPIPPLDGSKILLGWSDNHRIQYYLNQTRMGLILIIFLAFILPAILQEFGISFNPLVYLLRHSISFVINLLL